MLVEEQCPVFTPVIIFEPFMQSWATEEKKHRTLHHSISLPALNASSLHRFIASSLHPFNFLR
jgi:predicted ATPase